MKKSLMLAALVVAASSAATRADSYNADVVTNPSTGNLYFGTGNPNGNFATSQGAAGGVLGLRADIAFGNLITGTTGPTGVDNLYVVPAGVQTSGADAGDALWDFVYSIDVSGTSYSLSDYLAVLTVTAPDGTTGSFFPLALTDNGGTSTIAQNAENISFGGGNPYLPGTYKFDLELAFFSPIGPYPTASDTIFVQVVPLPSATGMSLVTFGAFAALGLLRKKLRPA